MYFKVFFPDILKKGKEKASFIFFPSTYFSNPMLYQKFKNIVLERINKGNAFLLLSRIPKFHVDKKKFLVFRVYIYYIYFRKYIAKKVYFLSAEIHFQNVSFSMWLETNPCRAWHRFPPNLQEIILGV